MSDSIKNNEYLNELIRYKNNKLSNQDMHRLEEALERDPFLAEALDGFSDFKTSDIEKDLNSIDLISGKSKLKISPKIYLTVAASIAVLVVSFFVYRNLGNTEQMASNEQVEKEPANLLIDTVVAPVEVDSNQFDQVDTVDLLIAKAGKQKSDTEKKERKAASRPVEEPSIADAASGPDTSTRELTAARKKVDEVPVSMAAVRAEGNDSVVIGSGQIAKTAKLVQPELDDEIQSDQSDQLIVMKGVVSSAVDTSDQMETIVRVGANAKPEPLGGFDLFKEYLDDNLNYPSSEEKASREVVRISFTVATNGELSNFVVDKAPENTDFSTEAIRLLKAGPKWSPAVKDGVPVDEEVSYRIVFKPSGK